MARRRSRRGQHSWHIWYTLFKLALLLGLGGGALFYAYQTGLRLGERDMAALRQQIGQQTAAEAAATARAATLAATLDDATKRADGYKARIEQLGVNDDVKDLLALIRAKLAAGLDAKRLAFVIQQAAPPNHCGATVTKRFMVRTGKIDGAVTWVRFSDLITVSAHGDGGDGGTQSWYDPAKPVTVTFTVLGGKDTTVEGTLPLHHAMVAKGGEFHFTIAPGARGFVEVSSDRCDFHG